MMEFYRNLYWSESLQPKKEKILKKLKAGKPQMHLYLIVLPEGGKNQLEFFDSLLLRQKWFFPRENWKVAGIADGYDAAVDLVYSMMEETVQKTGQARIREYLEQNWE